MSVSLSSSEESESGHDLRHHRINRYFMHKPEIEDGTKECFCVCLFYQAGV